MSIVEKGKIYPEERAINEMSLKIRSIAANEAFVRNSVCAFISALDPKISELEDVKTAVSEAFTNCVVHGYEGSNDGEIEVITSLFENYARIVIKDHGKGILDLSKAVEPFFTSRPDQDRSGLGFTIMETFMNGLKVNSDNNGTTVTLYKQFDRQDIDGEC